VNRLAEIEALARTAPQVDVLATIEHMPIHAFTFGGGGPTLLVTAGVHGVEQIGTDVAIAYLTSLLARMRWDRVLHDALARCRVIVVPLLNPVGMARNQRANGNGVDLMRNAPIASTGGTPLLGGQQLSRHLPWFMGHALEPEARALIELVEGITAPCTIALDLHSGYGFRDRIWYPYARTREAPPDLPAIESLARLLDDTLPNHVYRVEQTAQAYTIRGDLWDYLYDQPRTGTFLPLTLEMGSWTWVRKNPLQGLTNLGRFNPVKPHRLRRTLRRHLPLLDFLLHATASHDAWLRPV
jgi:predicted deacylase